MPQPGRRSSPAAPQGPVGGPTRFVPVRWWHSCVPCGSCSPRGSRHRPLQAASRRAQAAPRHSAAGPRAVCACGSGGSGRGTAAGPRAAGRGGRPDTGGRDTRSAAAPICGGRRSASGSRSPARRPVPSSTCRRCPSCRRGCIRPRGPRGCSGSGSPAGPPRSPGGAPAATCCSARSAAAARRSAGTCRPGACTGTGRREKESVVSWLYRFSGFAGLSWRCIHS